MSIKQRLHNVYRYFRPVYCHGQGNRLELRSKCKGRLRLDVDGNDNTIIIDEDVYLLNIDIAVTGNNNVVRLSKNSRLYDLKLRMVGDGNKFHFGVNAGAREADILIMEGTRVIIGDDSMLSYGIHIRTSDSHSIFDNETGNRINPPRDIVVGNHSWIAQNVTLLKGAEIGDNAVVGFGAVCSKPFPGNCIIAGVPARVIKQNISWDRKLAQQQTQQHSIKEKQ